MKAVKTMQKYKCDFCKKRGIKSAMERHEVICFRNPDRFCTTCKNTGKEEVTIDGPYGDLVLIEQPCTYCSKFDAQQLKEIEAREKATELLMGTAKPTDF